MTNELSCKPRGFTLIEVMVAIAIVAIISVISFTALESSIKSQEVLNENLAKLAKVERTWMLIEADLKNVLAKTRQQSFGPGSGSELPPLVIENGEDYLITVLRGGHANPLNFPRTELIRVGYRIEDETLWRDVWYDVASVDPEQTQQQKVIDNVESVEIRVITENASSISAGPWTDRWPQQNIGQLPLALEINLKLQERAEIKRLYSLVTGE